MLQTNQKLNREIFQAAKAASDNEIVFCRTDS